MRPASPLMILSALLWLALVIAASILYRRRAGKPIFPQSPANAVFVEKRCSGSSQSNVLTQLGGARNCLLVYVARDALHIVPHFPFNLMFMPEIWKVEATAALSDIEVSSVKKSLDRMSILVTIKQPKRKSLRLWLRRADEFRAALLQS